MKKRKYLNDNFLKYFNDYHTYFLKIYLYEQ
jgi:hypothetical protein